jgi:hypothetical protein
MLKEHAPADVGAIARLLEDMKKAYDSETEAYEEYADACAQHSWKVLGGVDPNTSRVKDGQPSFKKLFLTEERFVAFTKKYKEHVEWCFVGALPDFLQDKQDKQKVAPAWRHHVAYALPVPIMRYPSYVAKSNCHIALAPLVQHPFNEAKSEIKVLEAWAMGLPIVCSKIAPYMRAVSDGVDGLLVTDSKESWENALTKLIEDPALRTSMGAAGLKALDTKGYLMPSVVRAYEKALLTICRGRVGRPEAEDAITKRLSEIGG